jgi:choline dehydrogenase
MDRFDYIVVGGGTAGCVLAARLSEDPGHRVLLLEAGSGEPSPAMASPLAWPALAGTPVDWAYETVPQPGAGGAAPPWPRGRVLGGSSGINGMMHIRGDRRSYDAWERAGATGWNYERLLPFFKKSESAAGNPAFRGARGPMRVAPFPVHDELWEGFFQAAVEVGHRPIEDANGQVAEGVAWNDVNVVDGKRQSAADGYLTPAVRERPNLTITTDAVVLRLLVERDACQGVEYRRGTQTVTVCADREVILTAGTVATPQLLMLSGIGPGAHLREHGIPVTADLPGVGRNLQDHPKAQVAYTATRQVRGGPYARKPHVLLRTNPAVDPDIQILFIEFPVHPRWQLGPEDGYSVLFSLMTPASRGTVKLASADPGQPPLIDPRYLTDPSDVTRMIAGLRAAREIGAANELAPLRKDELFPGSEATADAELRDYLQRAITTYFHPVGTCRIGTDDLSVVDPWLLVHGIGHLRVADASVMPSLPSANTNAAVLAIAERAAAMITESHWMSLTERPGPVLCQNSLMGAELVFHTR